MIAKSIHISLSSKLLHKRYSLKEQNLLWQIHAYYEDRIKLQVLQDRIQVFYHFLEEISIVIGQIVNLFMLNYTIYYILDMNQLANNLRKPNKFIKMFTIPQENNVPIKMEKIRLNATLNPQNTNLNSNKLHTGYKVQALDKNKSTRLLVKQTPTTQQGSKTNRSSNGTETLIINKYRSYSNIQKRDQNRQAMKIRLEAKVKTVQNQFQEMNLELEKFRQEKKKIIETLNASQKGMKINQ